MRFVVKSDDDKTQKLKDAYDTTTETYKHLFDIVVNRKKYGIIYTVIHIILKMANGLKLKIS